MNTRPVNYKGRWYQVPVSTRNDAYCKNRDAGMSHEAACVSGSTNWMAPGHGIHPLANAKRNVRTAGK